MKTVDSVAALEQIYDKVVQGALDKVQPRLSPLYQQWVSASSFLILSTVGPGGTDASPRGDVGSVAKIVDPNTLWIPDWRGNNRLDSLRNIVEDGRVSLMFMIPHNNNVIRINGTAVLTTDETVVGQFTQNGKQPRTVIVVSVAEVYFQCAKALMRSRLWQVEGQGDGLLEVPTAGQFLKEVADDFDADAYDSGYAEYAKDRMW